MTFRSYLTVVGPLAILLTVAPPVRAQGAIPPAIYDTTGTAWTYAIYLAVPWPKVDSLVKLERFHSAWRDRSIEMGCFLDHVFLIHQTGDEYNVLYATTYDSPRPIRPGRRAPCVSWRMGWLKGVNAHQTRHVLGTAAPLGAERSIPTSSCEIPSHRSGSSEF